MRKKLEQTLIDLVSKDKSVYLLVNDLGSFESFRKLFPNNFINCGIGEPNMVSVAAGLSLSEKLRSVIKSFVQYINMIDVNITISFIFYFTDLNIILS